MNRKEITPTASFSFHMRADSMQNIERIAAFEVEFNVQMDERKAREMQTVEGAVEFIAG